MKNAWSLSKAEKMAREEIIECDVVLSSAYVSPNTENIGLEILGIATDRGLIVG